MSLYPTSFREAKEHKYNFWKNKPVPKVGSYLSMRNGPIDKNYGKDGLYKSTEPIKVPPLEWRLLKNSEDGYDKLVNHTTLFLNKYDYIEENENYRPLLTPDHVRLMLGSNGEILALMYKTTMVGVIGWCTQSIKINKNSENVTHVKFICVHPKYRQKYDKKGKLVEDGGIVNALLDETLRRVCSDIEQNTEQNTEKDNNYGMFFTERFVPHPFTATRRYYRPLNYSKLLKHKFTLLEGDEKQIHKRFLDSTEPAAYYHKATKDDLDSMLNVYEKYREMFNVSLNLNRNDLEILLFNPVVRTYVMKSKSTNKVIDFVSVVLQDKQINQEKDTIRSAHLFLYTCDREDPSLLGTNLIRLLLRDEKLDLLYVNDTNQSRDMVLSYTKHPDTDSDEEEDGNKTYDMLFMKDHRKMYVNLFNYKTDYMQAYQLLLPHF